MGQKSSKNTSTLCLHVSFMMVGENSFGSPPTVNIEKLTDGVRLTIRLKHFGLRICKTNKWSTNHINVVF